MLDTILMIGLFMGIVIVVFLLVSMERRHRIEPDCDETNPFHGDKLIAWERWNYVFYYWPETETFQITWINWTDENFLNTVLPTYLHFMNLSIEYGGGYMRRWIDLGVSKAFVKKKMPSDYILERLLTTTKAAGDCRNYEIIKHYQKLKENE